MSHSPQEQMLQFLHPEKILAFLPSLDDRQISALFGLDGETYQAIKRRFAAQAREAAQELLADPVFATHVDHLPFRPGAPSSVSVKAPPMTFCRGWRSYAISWRRDARRIRSM